MAKTMRAARASVVAVVVLGPLVLAPGPARATSPGRSGAIVFAAAKPLDAPRGLFRVDADGSGLARVLPKATWEDMAAAWSPDGTTLAFTSDRGGSRDIWSFVPGSGEQPVQLTDTPKRQEWLPTWSPDGRLAFLSERARRTTIDVLDPATGARTSILSARALYGVEWSPRGSRIAYAIDRGGAVAIGAVHPDGSGRARWSGGLAHAVVYDWRPDARWVVFQGDAGGRRALFEIAAGGTHRIRRLTHSGPGEIDQHAVYAPGGTKVAFVRTTAKGDELWLVRADGAHERRLRACHRMRVYGVTWQPLT
ncbi:MAG: TolB family protein [Planctomycetaceae bacterium]